MTYQIIQKMIAYFETDVRRINHALKVYGFASCLSRQEKLSEQDILIIDLAALLHDIGIKEAERKHGSSNGTYQELEGPPVARKLLKGTDLNNESLERICYLIGHHHSYQQIDGIDFQILVEADFLVNIHEDQLSRHAIDTIREKYFKTKSGIAMFEGLYPTHSKKQEG